MINKQSAIMMALLAFASDANGQAATLQEYVDAQEALAIGERECDSAGLATDLTDLGATAEITTALDEEGVERETYTRFTLYAPASG